MDLDFHSVVLISILFFLIAAAYSSVGHAGASGYAAVFALFNASPEVIRPTALILNIAVGLLGITRFSRAGLVDFKKIAPFLITSIPAVYFSAQLKIDKKIFFLVLGLILLVSAIKLFIENKKSKHIAVAIKRINLPVALFSGVIIGFLSGITGTGGAIFLTPLLLVLNWANVKEAAGLSICFVLVNSIFGLVGVWQITPQVFVPKISLWVFLVLLGAWVGTHLSLVKFSDLKLRRILGFVLMLAAYKLLLGAFAAN